MKRTMQPGAIGLAEFPLSEKAGQLLHPVLILSVEDTLSGMSYARVAYGSSRHVSVSGHLAWEFVLVPEDEKPFADSGLRRGTRFDLRKTARIPMRSIRPIGLVNLDDHETMNRLRAALFASQ